MGKTPNLKNRALSKHSRAAKRAASPSLDVDKSLLSLDRPASPTRNNPSGQSYQVLAAQSNGITKKKSKKETRSQRLRREKGLNRAEANLDILEVKRERSKAKAQVIKERSRAWDEVDGRGKKGSKSALGALGDKMDEDDWEDDDDEDVVKKQKTGSKATKKLSTDDMPVETDVDDIT